MASDTLDRVAMLLAETGNTYTSVVANQLIADRFNAPAEAGAVNGKSYWWMIEDNSTDYMIFEGTWTAVGTLIAIGTIWHSKIAGVHGTTKLTLSGSATLRSVTPAEIFGSYLNVDKAQSFSSTQQSLARANISAAPINALASRNLLINGAQRISQENGATAVTGIGGDKQAYVTDGYFFPVTGGSLGVVTGQQVTDAPPGFTHSLKITLTTADPSPAAAAQFTLRQSIEGSRLYPTGFGSSSAQPLVMIEWVKTNVPGVYYKHLIDSGTTVSYLAKATLLANVWTPVSWQVPAQTSGTFSNGNGAGMYTGWCLSAGSNLQSGTSSGWLSGNYKSGTDQTNWCASLTGGSGSAAPTFQTTGGFIAPISHVPTSDQYLSLMRAHSEELTSCARYFLNAGMGWAGNWTGSNTVTIAGVFQTEMCTTPTAVLSSTTPAIIEVGVSDRIGASSTLSLDYGSTKGAIVSIDGFSGATAQHGAIMHGEYLKFSARL